MEPRLLEALQEHVRPKLLEEFGFTNVHQVPRIQKVVVNVGSASRSEPEASGAWSRSSASITGQKPS
jgi:large subunit ribosomal protein L5